MLESRSANDENTFTFIDAYIVWHEDTYMLDYAITAIDNPPLDYPITISYRVNTNNGYSKIYSYVIPAGSTGFWEEGTTLGESIIEDMGLDGLYCYVTDIDMVGYTYLGSMTLEGLEYLSTAPPGTFD